MKIIGVHTPETRRRSPRRRQDLVQRPARVVLVLLIAGIGTECLAQPGWRGRGCGPCAMGASAAASESPPKQTLTDRERAGLLLMREEEKLARDVYVVLGKSWPLRPLQHIPRAETMHQEAVAALLQRHDVPDPVDGKRIGEFADPAMQSLHDKLVTRGKVSELAAINVGLEIEELDIVDLDRLLGETDNDEIRAVYAALRYGSCNHLRAFARQLRRYGAAYRPQHLAEKEYAQIIAGDRRGGPLPGAPPFGF